MSAYTEVSFAPGAISSGNNVNLPSNSPAIDTRFTPGSTIFRGSDAASPAAEQSVTTSTVEDESTVTLGTTTNSRDWLILRYIPKGAIRTWRS